MILKMQRHFFLGILLTAGFIAGWNAGLCIHADVTPIASINSIQGAGPGQDPGTTPVRTFRQTGPRSADPDWLRPVHDQIHSFTASISPNSPHAHLRQSSGTSRPEEKRHKKTRIREAFVAQFSVPLPRFTWSVTQYPLLTISPCLQQPTGNFSLRGPPACS
ncbi:MAG TPA: hypothetical protein VK563_21830 [Puia sp.]|nr:hypothetical protein [Puia sp.]